MGRTTLTDDEEKEIRSADGELLGRVGRRGDRTDRRRGRRSVALGARPGELRGESFPLDEDNVAEVIDETVWLAER
jgi:hypothetical protein